MTLLDVMDSIGVVAFALSGAYVAIERRLDIFGIIICAFATACGGGITRDVVMDVGVPRFFSSYLTIWLVLGSVVFAIVTKNFKWEKFMLTADAIGLAVFAIATGVTAINSGYNMPQFLFVSVITAVGGGVIRDLLVQRVPVILRKEIYASAALVGALSLWFLAPYTGLTIATYVSLGVVFVVRMYSVVKNLNLPVIELDEQGPAQE